MQQSLFCVLDLLYDTNSFGCVLSSQSLRRLLRMTSYLLRTYSVLTYICHISVIFG